MSNIPAGAYTVERVALMLHVSPGMIIGAIEQGKLKAVKNDGTFLISDESMREFMEHGNPFVAWEQYTIIHRKSGIELVSGVRFKCLDEAVTEAERMNREAGSSMAVVWRIEHTGAQPIQQEMYDVVDKTYCKTIGSRASSRDAIVLAMDNNDILKNLGVDPRFIVQTSNCTWIPIESSGDSNG